MERKKLLFNYYMKKAVETEKQLLSLKSDKAAMLALIFATPCVYARHISGMSMEIVYRLIPRYAEELFLIVCLDALKHGDKLIKSFDFEHTTLHHYALSLPDLVDKEITEYVNEVLYPTVRTGTPREVLTELLNTKTSEQLDQIANRYAVDLCRDAAEDLQLPEPCAETEMIDRAWERLTAKKDDNDFNLLLKFHSKYDRTMRSQAHSRYENHFHELLNA